MDLCIKTDILLNLIILYNGFNPCFNGSMYKNTTYGVQTCTIQNVSILVLMDLCIKTQSLTVVKYHPAVSILVLMDLCIKTISNSFIVTSP